MLIRCPCCGSENSLDSLIDNEAASKTLALALSFHPVGSALVKYIGLFRPNQKKLSWTRMHKLLDELLPMIQQQRIERKGQVYDTTMQVWESALIKVIEARNSGALQMPLKSHGYLLEVVITECSKGVAPAALIEVEAQSKPVTKSKTLQAIEKGSKFLK